jgi:hypothetical protein
VFVVGGVAAGHAEQILALNESVSGNPPTRREAGQDFAADPQTSSTASCRVYGGSSQSVSNTVTSKWHKQSGGPAGSECGLFVAEIPMYQEVVGPLLAVDYKGINNQYVQAEKVIVTPNTLSPVTHAFYSTGGSHGLELHPELSPPLKVAYRKSRRAQSNTDCETWVDDGRANTLNAFDTGDTRTTHAVCSIQGNLIGRVHGGLSGVGVSVFPLDLRNAMRDPEKLDSQNRQGCGIGEGNDPAPTISGSHPPGIALPASMVVRRLTPVECERLQGFPDGWTDIGTAEKPTSDTHRYKELGNAVTVNVAEWIARRAMGCLR